jgi:hypothetical protein
MITESLRIDGLGMRARGAANRHPQLRSAKRYHSHPDGYAIEQPGAPATEKAGTFANTPCNPLACAD